MPIQKIYATLAEVTGEGWTNEDNAVGEPDGDFASFIDSTPVNALFLSGFDVSDLDEEDIKGLSLHFRWWVSETGLTPIIKIFDDEEELLLVYVFPRNSQEAVWVELGFSLPVLLSENYKVRISASDNTGEELRIDSAWLEIITKSTTTECECNGGDENMGNCYITVQQIRDRVPDIENLLHNRAEGTEEDDYIETAIKDSCGIIDAYIGRVYAVPYPTPNSMLKHIAYLLTHYHLLRINYYQESETTNDMVQSFYTEAMNHLKMIVDGEIVLDSYNGDSNISSNTVNEKPVFTHTRRDFDGNIIEIGSTENW